ncbi:MAG: DUF3072 domain-containing protein [Flavisolibacter sp.]|nr:DUF3072 domain-containing protein [Flavisolibacter sp.]MBD0352307.1 DUF3072 domain-containing protein [Flavisolibacter sp.]MBD0365532.1 DUF3072 domain-containing protein [Flavisolibacter sp.]
MSTTNNQQKKPQSGNVKNTQDTNQNNAERSNTVKDPDEWTTGDEPMTGAQQSYLKTLSDEAGEELDTNLSKAEASKKIDELQHKTGRGLDNNNSRS